MEFRKLAILFILSFLTITCKNKPSINKDFIIDYWIVNNERNIIQNIEVDTQKFYGTSFNNKFIHDTIFTKLKSVNDTFFYDSIFIKLDMLRDIVTFDDINNNLKVFTITDIQHGNEAVIYYLDNVGCILKYFYYKNYKYLVKRLDFYRKSKQNIDFYLMQKYIFMDTILSPVPMPISNDF